MPHCPIITLCTLLHIDSSYHCSGADLGWALGRLQADFHAKTFKSLRPHHLDTLQQTFLHAKSEIAVLIRIHLGCLSVEPVTTGLSKRVLELHQGIRTVLITREDDGEWKTIEEAIRPGVMLLEESREEARAQLSVAPALLIGASDAIKGKAGELEIVAILYQRVGAVFAALDPAMHRIMCVTTERDALEDVVKVVRQALTKLMKGS